MKAPLVVFLLAVLGTAPSLYAQQDARAEKILKNSRNKVNKLKTLEADFNKSTRTNSGKAVGGDYSGKLVMKGSKFRLQLNDQVIICDGSTQWAVNQTDKEVLVSNYDPKEGFTADKLFSVSQEDMKSAYIGQEPIGNIMTDYIELVPKKQEDYFKIKMWVSVNSSLPRKMEIYYRNGTIVTYTMSHLHWNGDVPSTAFAFSKSEWPGFYIEDMR